MGQCRTCGAFLPTQACENCPPVILNCPSCGAENLVERESGEMIAAILRERRKGKR